MYTNEIKKKKDVYHLLTKHEHDDENLFFRKSLFLQHMAENRFSANPKTDNKMRSLVFFSLFLQLFSFKMKCPSVSQVQRGCMAMVNASPMALLLCIFGWSFWAYNFRLGWSLASDGQVLQGNIKPFFNHFLLMFFFKRKAFLYILFYNPLFCLTLWSYWVVCRTSPGFTTDVKYIFFYKRGWYLTRLV
jgi:hypothetical protein